MITDEMPRFHPRYSYRILYVGRDHSLSKFLRDELEECQIIGCPNGSLARTFIEKIKYSLLLFDKDLPDTTGKALRRFTRSLPRRQGTPTIIFKASDDDALLARTITHLLDAQPSRENFLSGLFYRSFNRAGKLRDCPCNFGF